MSTRHARPRLDERLEAVRLEEPEPSCPHICEWPGCQAAGEFRAPRGRHQLRDFMLLCLEHVREYNLGWNYFSGMSEDEVEAHRRADSTWHRPSWPFGATVTNDEWRDPFDLFEAGFAQKRQTRNPSDWRHDLDPTTVQMMSVLALEPGFNLEELKDRYKQLAKANHPDLHQGDKAAEERLKKIIEAYKYLKETCDQI